MHPYEMAQLMRERYVAIRVKVKAGSLYHTVERLLDNGFIEISETQREGRRPERTVYRMTAAGRDAFVERAQTMLGTPAEEYPEYLSGLAVVAELGREMALNQLKHRAVRLEAAAASDQVLVTNLHEIATARDPLARLAIRDRAAGFRARMDQRADCRPRIRPSPIRWGSSFRSAPEPCLEGHRKWPSKLTHGRLFPRCASVSS
jgi:DNA-binding PadR family transcriptional regulator